MGVVLQFGVERASCSGVELSYGEVELSYSLGSTERAFAISVRLSPGECWSRNSLSGSWGEEQEDRSISQIQLV